jgi:hypothetical protein
VAHPQDGRGKREQDDGKMKKSEQTINKRRISLKIGKSSLCHPLLAD